MGRRISLLLHDDFFKNSLNVQLRGMGQVSQFVRELVGEKSQSKAKLIVRYGSRERQSVKLTEDGILELPMNFSLEDVHKAVSKQ